MHNKKIQYIIIAVIFISLGIVYLIYRNQERVSNDVYFIMQDEGLSGQNPSAEGISHEDTEEAGMGQTQENVIYVYVCGYVNDPGVYQFAEGSRRFEAIEAAGGIKESGCAELLELAGVLTDGERIYVPSEEEAEAVRYAENSGKSGLINLNQAGKEQLMTLPGIGESRAEAILQYRENNGAFGSIEDIMKVSGIKEAAFAKIKDYICV